MKTRKNSKTDRESQRALARKGGVKTEHPTNPPDSKSDCLIIGGKTYTLPAELIQEIAAKLQPREPETFEDCISKFTDAVLLAPSTLYPEGNIHHYPRYDTALRIGGAVPSERRARQLAAIAKMMTVADALNGDSRYCDYWLCLDSKDGVMVTTSDIRSTKIGFRHLAAAEKAIKILGEDVIKTAFGL